MLRITVIAIVSLLSRIHLSSSCLTGYVPDASEPENPDTPEPESIKDVERKVNHECACGISGFGDKSLATIVKDDLLAVPNEFPWTVYLRINNSLPGKNSRRDKPLRRRIWTWAEREGHHDCVGTIINDLFILTSSGCILNFYPDEDSHISKQFHFETWIKKKREIKPSEIYVYLNLTFKTAGVLQNSLIVEKIFYHAQTSYATRNFRLAKDNDYDIVLLKLKNRLKFGFSQNFSPICLPRPGVIKDYNSIYTFANGWFSRPINTSRSNENVGKLHKVTTGAIFNLCQDIFKEGVILPNYLCSRDPLRFMDAGSSLVAKTKNDKVFLLGILSWIVPHISGNLSITQNQNRLDRFVPYGLFSKITSKPIQSFIDYHTKREGAHWCSEPDEPKFLIRPSIGYEEPPPVDEPANIIDSCVCGQRTSGKAKPRVVGGEEAIPYEFPWIVWLFIQGDDPSSGSGKGCGATIINDRLLLTAAHCVTREEKNGVRIVLPADRLTALLHTHAPTLEFPDKRLQDPGFQALKIQRVIVHSEYINSAWGRRQDQNEFDIALLLLPIRLDITKHVYNPICMPRHYDLINIPEGQEATVAGWGLTDRVTSEPAQKLQKIVVPLHSAELCKKLFSRGNTEQFMCGDEHTIKGAGQGDSGGPLFMILPSQRAMQIGVVSYGANNQTILNPSKSAYYVTFYTRVIHFIDWVEFHSASYEVKWCKRDSAPNLV